MDEHGRDALDRERLDGDAFGGDALGGGSGGDALDGNAFDGEALDGNAFDGNAFDGSTLDRIAIDRAALAATGEIDLEIGEDTVSLLLTFALEDDDHGLGIARVIAPDGTVVHDTVFEDDSWEAVRFASDLVAEPVVDVGNLALFVPAATGTTLAAGTWRVALETDPPDARFVHASAVVRSDGDGAVANAEPHVVDLHVHVVHPDARYRDERFVDALDTLWRDALERTLAPHALGIGTTSVSVATPRETTRLAELDDEREIAEACRAIRRAGKTRSRSADAGGAPTLHVGLVREIASYGGSPEEIAESDLDGGELTGLSPQPGLPFDAESANACVFVAEGPWRTPGVDGAPLDEATVIELLAANLLHELGHFAGLAHPSEADGKTFDLLDDTPRCTAPDAESCGVAGGADNLMFHSGDERTLPWTLTPDQARVLRVHPLFRPVAGRAR